MNPHSAKWIIVAGIVMALFGTILYFFHDKLHWLGRLPGDARAGNGNTRFYFPVVTMLIISLLITLIVNIIKRLFP
jgi:uncharacterized membrane protein (DUF106 family)